jgi:hypothetical protein
LKLDEGKQLSGHVHNGGRGARLTKRIPRVWVAAYIVSTARYDVDTLIDAFIGAARQFSPELQRRIGAELLDHSQR